MARFPCRSPERRLRPIRDGRGREAASRRERRRGRGRRPGRRGGGHRPHPPKREAPVAHAALAPSVSIDEELDYLVAKRLGSLAGWRAFLATHGSGAYAQSARAEVERLLPTGKAPAPAAPGVSNGASTDASTAGKAMGAIPSPRGTEVASGYATPAPPAAEVLNDSSPDAKAVSEAVGPAPPLNACRNGGRGARSG